MLLEQEQLNTIRQEFAGLQTKEDLLKLLNQAKGILFNKGEKRPISLKSLTWYSNTTLKATRYHAFTIPKKRGGKRPIYAPVRPLKIIQQCLNLIFQSVFSPHKAAMGFVPGKSIVSNAQEHVGKYYILNLDLENFFPSINFHRVKACLQLPPFNLTGDREPLAFLLANLCCEQHPTQPKQAFLPQGAPTSPVITNIVCQQLDRRLTGLAKRFGATYTRYADDLTFSSYTNVYQADGEFWQELQRIIADQRFTINAQKTRLQKAGYRQEVTGLVVNEKMNISQTYLREVRQLLYIWKKYGEVAATEKFLEKRKIPADAKKKPVLVNVLDGKLLYLKMVRGSNDALYQRYSLMFDMLIGRNQERWPIFPVEERVAKLTEIIELYKNGDIAKAAELMEVYKKTRQASDEQRTTNVDSGLAT
jgi:RNA-directed DNA polymerase